MKKSPLLLCILSLGSVVVSNLILVEPSYGLSWTTELRSRLMTRYTTPWLATRYGYQSGPNTGGEAWDQKCVLSISPLETGNTKISRAMTMIMDGQTLVSRSYSYSTTNRFLNF